MAKLPINRKRASPRPLNQRNLRTLLHPIKHDLISAARHVEVANRRLRSQVGELALRAGLQVDEREVLVAHVAAKYNHAASVTPKHNSARAAREDECRQGIWPPIRGDGAHRKRRADVRARID